MSCITFAPKVSYYNGNGYLDNQVDDGLFLYEPLSNNIIWYSSLCKEIQHFNVKNQPQQCIIFEVNHNLDVASVNPVLTQIIIYI